MRRLLLLRHAKAERAQPGASDHARVLTPRGRADARKLGAFLARHALIPDRAAVSTSARTRETWELLATEFKEKIPQVSFDDRIYDASPEALLQVIHGTASETDMLLVVGHNPSIQELAMMLIASGDIDARERLGEGFPTTALAAISFAAEAWGGVHPHGGRLEHFVAPDWLATATD